MLSIIPATSGRRGLVLLLSLPHVPQPMPGTEIFLYPLFANLSLGCRLCRLESDDREELSMEMERLKYYRIKNGGVVT